MTDTSFNRLKPEDVIKLIREFRLFKNVKLDEIPKHLEFQLIYLKPGEILLNPSEPNTRMFVLIEGKLSVHTQLHMYPVAYLGPGDCIGEMSLFEGELPSAYVVAINEAKVLAIHKEIIWRLVDWSNAFAQNMLHLLLQRIRSGNKTLSAVQEKLQVQEISAYIDPLTGLYNRRWLNNMFQRAVERSTRSDYDSAHLFLMMIDIDHFKKYNDKHGHLAGDQCLRMVASVLRDNMRPSDLLARYGGEEFGVLQLISDLDSYKSAAERLREAVYQKKIEDRHGSKLPSVTISIGIAELLESDSLDDLIERADRCLYKAKENGRNCVFFGNLGSKS